jgi:hypothetical protein
MANSDDAATSAAGASLETDFISNSIGSGGALAGRARPSAAMG